MTIIVPLAMLCEKAAAAMGCSYAKEHQLINSYPYPYREIKRVQALQKLCLTILRLAKHKPKDKIDVPVKIWCDLHDASLSLN